MRLKDYNRRPETGNWMLLSMVVMAALLVIPASAFAQGSIFGTVQNSDLSVPADGEISFFGFLDDTDEEIRIELSDGAGYQSGNWFDDFQNYLTEAAGNPYDYYFVNTTNGQTYHLANNIPNNSFQQENIVLVAGPPPAIPANVTARAISSSKMLVIWTGSVGSTYHVYRRLSSSNGSFFRVDNPAGSLANAGVVDTFFVDTTVDGVSSYTYVVIAQNAGQYSAHSALASASAGLLTAPIVTSITPATGPSVGGTAVTILGSGFDNSGVNVTIDGNPAASVTVVTAGRITATTPSGVGPADVVVANNSAALAGTLSNGFNYFANTAPVANAGPDQLGQFKNTLITLTGLGSTDPDLDSLTYNWLQTSGPAVILSSGTAAQPTFTASANGDYFFRLVVNDGVTNSAPDTVRVQVVERAPVLAAIGPQSVTEGANLNFVASAADADGTIPALSAVNLPANATFVNNGNGTGTFNFNPTFIQAGVYNVTVIASDGILADSEVVAITVNEAGNQRPVLAAIGPRNVTEGLNLNFNTSATDPDATIPTFSADNVPVNATYVDNGNGTATFNFNPDFTQAGVYNVTFIASDGSLADSEVVAITVIDSGNQRPVLAAIGPQSVTEGANLNFVATATDPDATTPTLTAFNVPLNATFVDNGNGSGTFNFNPSFVQSGIFNVTFIASDGALADSEVVAITVIDAGNQRPVLAAIGPQLVNEGANLNFNASATDPDGTTPTLSATGLPLGATFNNNGDGTGTFDFTPTFAQSGIYNVTFIATDGVLADSEVVAISVNDAGNQAPVLTTIGPRSVDEGAVLNFNISAGDPDSSIPTLSAVSVPANASFVDNGNGTGTFNFAPDFTQAGVFNITFIASDGFLADSEIVAVTVNDVNRPPVLVAIGAQSVTEGVLLSFNATATDPDATIPAMSAVNLPLNATFIDNANGSGTFNFTPGFNQSGVFNVTFVASDGLLADSEVVAITVIDAGNQRPVLATIGNRAVQEGNVLQFRISAADGDGSIPTLAAFSVPTNAIFVDSTNGAGSFTFSPNFNQAGIYNVLFVASDGVLADSESVLITVGEAGNLPPVLDSIGTKQIAEGNVLSFRVHATDEAGIPDLLVNTLMNNYVFVDSGNGAGSFTYSPDYFDAGVDTVTFFALDGDGAVDQEKVAITTLDINRPPKITPIANVTAVPGDSVKIHVVATDSTDADGGRLYLLALAKPTTAVFTDSTNNRGSLRWLPTASDTGVHQFIVLVTDDETPALSSRDTATITVVVTNQAPILAAIGTKSVPEGQMLEFRISATDPDGTTPFFYAQNIPQNAILIDSANGAGSFRFMPSFTQSGLYSVKIFASDGNKTDNETVLIQVTNVPQPPILVVPADTQFVTEGEILAFQISATDPDGTIPQLKIDSLLVPPLNSVFVDSGNGRGSFTFAPVFVQSGLYDLTFIATDGQRSDTALVIVRVIEAGNQTPVITVRRNATVLNDFDTVTVVEGDSIHLLISATDADSVTASLSSSSPLPFTAIFTDAGNGNGFFAWKTINLQLGIYNVTFYAIDGTDNQVIDSSRVVLKVNDLPNPPAPIFYVPFLTCTNPSDCGTRNVAEGGTTSITFYSNDADDTDPILTARLFTVTGNDTTILFAQPLPPNMSVNDMGDTAVFTFSPNFQQAGVYKVVMLAIDETDANVFRYSPWTFNVTNVSVPPVLNPIGPLSVLEGQTLDINITGSDPDGLPVNLTASGLPTGATFTALPGQPAGTATSRLLYTPGFTAAGVYNLVFRVAEATPPLVDTEMVVLTVIEAGPQSPVFVNLNASYTVNINSDILRLHLRSSDVDSPPAALSVSGQPIAPWNAVMVDSGNGRGSYTFDPIPNQKDSVYNLRFIALSGDGRADTMFTSIQVIDGVCGDADGSMAISIADVVYLINYIFSGGAAPTTVRGGDPDCSGATSVADVVYLINYIFGGGAAPCANCP